MDLRTEINIYIYTQSTRRQRGPAARLNRVKLTNLTNACSFKLKNLQLEICKLNFVDLYDKERVLHTVILHIFLLFVIVKFYDIN